MTHDDIQSAKETAVRLLSQRALSEAELRARLTRREFSAAGVDAAIASMQAYRYLDDARLAEMVRAAALSRGKGPQWIRQTLARRGVAQGLAQEAAQVDKATQTDQASDLLRRRFPHRITEPRDKQRAYRLLCSRGFTPDSAMDALRKHGVNLESEA